MKRYFDEEYRDYMETQSEEDDGENFLIFPEIFHDYKERLESGEPFVKLGGSQKQFAKKK